MVSDSLRISPHYTAGHWIALDLSTEEGWQKAIDILVDRIDGRFLKFISVIERCTYSGFVVLALDCLLIETLQQFREGAHRTPPRESREYFVRFLTETSFGRYFTSQTAEMFYRQIRSGIIHQAELEGSSKILVRENIPLVKYADDGEGLVINRRLFHQQLLREFEAYIDELRDSSSQELREKFKKKMEYICRVSAEVS